MPFLSNSRNVRYEDGVLFAECADGESILGLNTALGNINGEFKWGFQNFTATARNLALSSGGILSGQLKDENSEWRDASVDLGDHISDTDGFLAVKNLDSAVALPEQNGATTFIIQADSSSPEKNLTFRTFSADATAAVKEAFHKAGKEVEQGSLEELAESVRPSIWAVPGVPVSVGDEFVAPPGTAMELPDFNDPNWLAQQVELNEMLQNRPTCMYLPSQLVLDDAFRVQGSPVIDFGKLFGGW
ncbi:hypothetical protein JCM8097_004715 [Rhodosporidiobolus ruineniae]